MSLTLLEDIDNHQNAPFYWLGTWKHFLWYNSYTCIWISIDLHPFFSIIITIFTHTRRTYGSTLLRWALNMRHGLLESTRCYVSKGRLRGSVVFSVSRYFFYFTYTDDYKDHLVAITWFVKKIFKCLIWGIKL